MTNWSIYVVSALAVFSSIYLSLTASTVNNSTILANYNSAMGTSVTSFTRQSTDKWTSLYNVTFDYDELKGLGATDVKVTYKATVPETGNLRNY